MGIAIRIAGANFTHYVDRQVPHIDKSVGYWLLGVDESETALNRSPRAEGNAQIIGSPVIGAGYADLSESDYLDTGIQIDTVNGEWTMIAIAAPGAPYDAYCGTWHSEVADAMLYDSGTLSYKMAIRGGGSGVAAISRPDSTSITFMAGVKSGARDASTYLYNGTSMLSAVGTGNQATPAPNNYWIGPKGGLSTLVSPQRHCANLLFDTALTGQEIQDIYDYFAEILPGRGVGML